MELTEHERRLVAAIQGGLPLVQRPYREIARRAGMSEEEVISLLAHMSETGLIARFGVVVRHRELGYRANAMAVWDIPDHRVAEVGRTFGTFEFVTLCYQRPRRLPHWPYNLFCMVHGRERDTVQDQVALLARRCGLADVAHEVLFSSRCFKQRGARYAAIRTKATAGA